MIYTCFGSPVEIRYRCDDYVTTGGVHIAWVKKPNSDLSTTYTYRAEIMYLINDLARTDEPA